MLKRLINRYHRSFTYFGCRSPQNFNKYLIAHDVKLGEDVVFRYPKSVTIDLTRPSLIEIGDHVDINANFTIMTHDFGTFVFRNLYGDFIPSSGKVKIGNNIYFGRNVTILKGVEIGDNCIIGLGSVVTKSISPNSVVAGCPAKVICDIETYYKKRISQQFTESVEFGLSLIERKHRLPSIYDFKEEWVNFITKEDLEKYPKYENVIRLRLKNHFEDYIANPPHRKFFGFQNFLEYLKSKENIKT